MSDLHLLRPWWLLGIVPLLAVVYFLFKYRSGKQLWERVVDPALMPFVLEEHSRKKQVWPVFLLALAGMLAVIALTGPVWEKLPVPVYKGENKIVLVLDLSQSMDATDVKPSRLARARHKVGDILGFVPDAQIGLIIFSQVPYIISPITDDAATVASLLPALSTSVVPVQGSQLSLALDKAGELLLSTQAEHGQVIVLTDSAVTLAEFEAAKKLRDQGFILSVLGIGTSVGGPINLGEGQLLKDNNKQIVIVKLDRNGLRDLANSVGGRYSDLDSGDADIRHLVTTVVSKRIQNSDEATTQSSEIWLEQTPWLLPFILVLAAGLFRRGVL